MILSTHTPSRHAQIQGCVRARTHSLNTMSPQVTTLLHVLTPSVHGHTTVRTSEVEATREPSNWTFKCLRVDLQYVKKKKKKKNQSLLSIGLYGVVATSRAVQLRIPVSARYLLHTRTNRPRTHPASCTTVTKSFPGVKRPGRDADYSHPSIAEVKHGQNCGSKGTLRVDLYLLSPRSKSRPENCPSCHATFLRSYVPTRGQQFAVHHHRFLPNPFQIIHKLFYRPSLDMSSN